tara:strand:- start:302 stop:475 length:174 start_codon:yes stop_codon:yes gene_type:complete
MQKYYKDQLEKLDVSGLQDSIQITLGVNRTNYLAINKDSLEALKNWIYKLEKNTKND